MPDEESKSSERDHHNELSAKKDQPTKADDKPRSAGRAAAREPRPAGRVSLRSDAPGAVVGRRVAGLDTKWLVAGGILLLLLLLAAVAALATKPGRKLSVDNGDGLFGNLPNALDAVRGPATHSGLSGRACDDPDRRPIGAMLSSDVITRPVSGFAAADMVWELPVLVSDVTRLMAVYQCGRPEEIGSVRSARHDYLFLAEGSDVILGHWGGSYHALNRIGAGEFDTINALGNPFSAFFRKGTLPAPYNGFTTYENLWNALQKLEYRTKTTFEGYEFKDDPEAGQRGPAGTLSIGWPGSFRVHYEYDPATNRYQRFWGGVKQVDGGPGGEDVAPSVVVIMRAGNQFAEGPGGYNDVDVEGEGDLTVYQDGGVVNGRWRKNELEKTDPVHFMDESGRDITFTRGQVWVMVVEPEIAVTWEPQEPVAVPEEQQAGAPAGP